MTMEFATVGCENSFEVFYSQDIKGFLAIRFFVVKVRSHFNDFFCLANLFERRYEATDRLSYEQLDLGE